MLSDIQIAQSAQMLPIAEVAAKLGVPQDQVIPYGRYKAKLSHKLAKGEGPEGKLILVTAISPTPAGEGKTTTSVGLADAMCALGKRMMLCLREPSLGPVFGIKGGAAGGGYAQVVPMEDINLHFTGDIHAIGTANNLLAAMIDNSIQQGNPLNIDRVRTASTSRSPARSWPSSAWPPTSRTSKTACPASSAPIPTTASRSRPGRSARRAR